MLWIRLWRSVFSELSMLWIQPQSHSIHLHHIIDVGILWYIHSIHCINDNSGLCSPIILVVCAPFILKFSDSGHLQGGDGVVVQWFQLVFVRPGASVYVYPWDQQFAPRWLHHWVAHAYTFIQKWNSFWFMCWKGLIASLWRFFLILGIRIG
jgi:hypothetical protein